MKNFSFPRSIITLSLAVLCLTTFGGCFLALPFSDTEAVDPEDARVAAAMARYMQQESPRTPQNRSTPSHEWMVNRFTKELSDSSATKRASAASYLGMLGEKAGPAVPSLMRALHDPERFVRRAAARSLGKIGKPALPARDALQQATKDRDEYVAHTARLALDKLQKIS